VRSRRSAYIVSIQQDLRYRKECYRPYSRDVVRSDRQRVAHNGPLLTDVAVRSNGGGRVDGGRTPTSTD